MDSCRVRRQSVSHIVIDLGRTDAGPALIALGHRKRRRKVKSALIMAQQAKTYIPWHNTDRNHVKTMLQAMGDFPNLTVLTIDLSYWKLQVVTLAVMLQATKSLKELTLRNLVLTGNLCDQNELEHVLLSQSNIQCLSLERCNGTATVRTLSTKISSLRKVKIVSSRISQSDAWASATLVEMCSNNPKIRSLTLCDVSDLDDQHVCELMEAIRSGNSPELHDLQLISPKAGQVAGEAILNFLLHSSSTSLCKLNLKLGGNWNTIGSSLARVLSVNVSLRKLKLRVCGSDVASQAIQIAHALSKSVARRLTQFELNMNISSMTASGECQKVLCAFESTLKQNHALEDLRFFDTNIDCDVSQSMITPFLRMKLDLNRSGLLKLLHGSNEKKSIPMDSDSYLKAMARTNQNLSVLFYALHNNPALFLRPKILFPKTNSELLFSSLQIYTQPCSGNACQR